MRQLVSFFRPVLRACAEAWIPCLFGLLACWLVTGGAGLAVGNTYWLTNGDLAQSYLGWAFYRHDTWTLPFGASPSYGLEFHSSVLYSDSIPLLAMPLKLIAAWLPEPFQYFGLWLLACFVLQAWFAWRLLGLATADRWARACALVFFVLAPPMLMRMGGHMALFAHWPLLAALYLYLRGTEDRRISTGWLVLLPVAFAIHAYVFLMVAGIWSADLLRRIAMARRAGERGWSALPWREIVLAPALTVVVAWLAGFFLVPGKSTQTDGYGYYKMNLLAPFDGAGWASLGWNGLATGGGENEGFNYLGLGGLGLCAAALLVWLFARRRPPRECVPRWPLWLLAVLLVLLAITNNVGLGALQWHLPLPFGLERRLAHSPVQGTGRLFWVMYYLLLVSAFMLLARVLRPRPLVLLLAALAVLQCADLSAGVRHLRELQLTRATAQGEPPLNGEFWQAAATRYQRLRLLPTRVLAPGWAPLAFYAQRHRMGTDAVQLARVDWKRFNRVRNAQRIDLLKGQPEAGTLYIVDERYAALADLAARPGDALFALDGYRVFAPGWNAALPAGAVDLRGSGGALLAPPLASGHLDDDDPARALLGEGWRDTAGGAGVETSRAAVFVPRGKDLDLLLDFRAIDPRKLAGQTIEATLDGRAIGQCAWSNDSCRRWRIALAGRTQTGGFDEIVLRVTPASSQRDPLMVLDRLALDAR